MFKIRIHVYTTSNTFFDENVFVDVNLPGIPRKGDYINIGYELLCELESKATSDINIAKEYYEWFYGKSYGIKKDDIKKENLDDLSFSDAILVQNVLWIPSSNIVQVEIMIDYNEEKNLFL